MKTIEHLARRLVSSLVVFTLMGLAMQALAAPTDQTATVLRVKGGARYSTDNRTWQALKVGDVLKPGCVIQTAEQSEVDLQLGGAPRSQTGPQVNNNGRGLNDIYNGSIANPIGGGAAPPTEEPDASVVRIQESTVLAIDKLTSDNTGAETVDDTQLDLRAGSVAGNVKKMSAASRYEVKIPNGVAGIRGTFYWLSSSGVVNVVTGSVIVVTVGSNGKVTEKVVKAGYSYNPLTGQITPIDPLVERILAAIVRDFHLESGAVAYTPPGAPPGTTVLVTPQFGNPNGG